MKGKHVSSSDPRKVEVVSAFKQLLRGNKITMVRDLGNSTFEADVLRGGKGRGKYENLGRYRIYRSNSGSFASLGLVSDKRAGLPSENEPPELDCNYEH
jgi:hypothetical protein